MITTEKTGNQWFDPWIRDPGWMKNQDPDPGS